MLWLSTQQSKMLNCPEQKTEEAKNFFRFLNYSNL